MCGAKQQIPRANRGHFVLDPVPASASGNKVQLVALVRNLRAVRGSCGKPYLQVAVDEHRTPGRSVFVDGDLEVRFAARPTDGPQVPHERDELYFVAAGTGRYRVEDKVTAVGPGDLL